MAERLRANRTRRVKLSDSGSQTRFSFGDSPVKNEACPSTAIEDGTPEKKEFSFTIAIGKAAMSNPGEELPMQIDVSSRPNTNGYGLPQLPQAEPDSHTGLYPVASFDDRRLAGLIDLFCLAFAYGGFLGLFGSLGGHLTLSKLSAAVCVATFAVVYMQYFALFTIFGGTTPGMMMRGLQVISFSGEPPTPRQMILRSVGYMLSAGTFFLGFLWAMWDCDELTWHDRLSRTYLSVEQTLPEFDVSDAARGR
ncbi:MAG TPA: RDD family protein [Candidatus Acidoferrum sp.]|nr:RDD family protein [Candidatus Acidoferrum sp.]